MTSSPPPATPAAAPAPAQGSPRTTCDVLIIGAGPVGLSLANFLGLRGVSVLLLESRDSLIDYPRGVGIDDESLRSVQTMGIVDRVLPYTTPNHIMRLVNGRGRRIVEIRPQTEEFGWSRRNAFNQPEVDRVLFEGLERFDNVHVRFGHDVEGIEDHGSHVTVRAATPAGSAEYSCSYLVGCDGGKSRTRKHLGVSFEGQSPSTRWLVIDMRDDPLSTPNIYLGADPRRPYVSLGLPQSIRRFEFMLFDHEDDHLVEDPEFIARLLAPHVPDPYHVDFIRQRVYTHHSRIAGAFQRGRIFLAGDAAHLMPVWQGQGWNSGERDATNLAWKLAAVIAGQCSPGLLETYDTERRDHAKAMIDLSTAFGRIVKPTNRLVTAGRDAAAKVLSLSARATEYFALMKYKPMPRYRAGAVVDASTNRPGVSEPELRGRLAAQKAATVHASPVGTQFIQPRVRTADGGEQLLDDVIGYGWAVLQWGGNPEELFTPTERAVLRRLGARLISIRPPSQVHLGLPADPASCVVGDHTGTLKRWFDDRPTPVLFLRPDRFVAAACLAQDAGAALGALTRAVHLAPARTRPASGPAATGETEARPAIGSSAPQPVAAAQPVAGASTHAALD